MGVYEIDRSKSLVITFDDGHISSYSVAFPILCNYKFKATFFIITERIGEKEYLSWRQIREMNKYRMEIGSHTVTHPILTELSTEKIKFELSIQKKWLKIRLVKQ